MSKFDDVIAKCTADLEEIGQKVNADLLHKVAKGLGPSIYNTDSSLVAASDKAELARVKTNFLAKKLGLKDDDSLDEGLASVVKTYNKARKHRPVFYYLLVQHFNKADIYG